MKMEIYSLSPLQKYPILLSGGSPLLASEAGELLDYAGAGGVGSPQVFFLAERPSRSSDWKLRAGKRANAEWQFR